MKLETGNPTSSRPRNEAVLRRASWKLEKRLILAGLALGFMTGMALAADGDASVLLEKTGVKGGLCLVVGAGDMTLANDLAAQSALYVQVLQPDAKRAAAWGAAVAASTNRESIGIRPAAMDASQYGSDLFNLIVIDAPGATGAARLADFGRILVPNGCLAFKAAPPALATEAKTLGMNPEPAPLRQGYAGQAGAYTVYRKPVQPKEWKLPLETKWKDGPRSQIANGYNGVCNADGKLFYIEQMERNAGDLNDCAAVVFARDAYNGRTLWRWEMPGRYGQHAGVGLVATSKGRLFAKTGTGQVLCLDAQTGKMLFEVASKVHRELQIWLLNDDLLSIHGDVRSAETGKPLWKYPSLRYQPLPGTIIGENIHFCDGASIYAKKVATGGDVWKVSTNTLPRAVGPGALSRAENHLLVRMAGSNEEAAFALLDSANGKLLWTYSWKVRIGGEKYFSANNVRSSTADGKLLLYYRHNQPGVYADEIVATKLDLATGKPEFEDKINKDAGDYHGCFPEIHLGDYIAYYDIWVNKKTLETARAGVPHPACFFGMSSANGLIFNFPSRKSGPISAVGPVDPAGAAGPETPRLQKLGPAPANGQAATAEWPVFRGSPAGGNATAATVGGRLAKRWESQVGMPGRDFGIMSSQRTGLSQAVLGYGLAIVADIDGQRIVALNAADGSQKWVFHVGSRVDYPPTLYKGLCLFAARDGWVYCLDAANGQPVYRLRLAPRERYMGTREKLESRWAAASDVLVAGDVAYVAVEGSEGVAFKPETGEIVENKDANAMAMGRKSVPGGRELHLNHDFLLKGNSIPRTNEDNWEGFSREKFGRNLDARVLAFDDKLTVAYQFQPAGEGWANKGKLTLKGITDNLKQPAWTSDPIELVVDDILLTPGNIYCVGHYQRVKKDPEIWVMSREDGKVASTNSVDGFPGFMGMSAAGNKLFVATREGKLICYEGR